ncbi:MAG TPA: GDSL-type esterase/lipase family protein [Tepidisphaeraceae bacterium]|nr:GDSL-type esterase/lipase family protein [Tepidisphaeraceae bacterium]
MAEAPGLTSFGIMGPLAAATTLDALSQVQRMCVLEGDSWFNYPLPFATGVDEVLRRRHRYGFVRRRFSDFGDTLESMALGPNWPTVKQAVQDSQARVFLLSAGGNDFAGPELVAYLNHVQFGGRPIRDASVRLLMDESFEPCIRRIAQDVQQVSPNTKIFMHGYAHALPNGRYVDLGFKRIGPWLKPAFDEKGWAYAPAKEGVARLIDLYNERLAQLAAALPNFVYVDLRPIVGEADWVNELHLSNDGFARCADAIHNAVKAVFPNW